MPKLIAQALPSFWKQPHHTCCDDVAKHPENDVCIQHCLQRNVRELNEDL